MNSSSFLLLVSAVKYTALFGILASVTGWVFLTGETAFGQTVYLYSGTTLERSGTTLVGPTGVEPITSGDRIVVTEDILSGGAISSMLNYALSIESNDSGVIRTIVGDSNPAVLDSGSQIVSVTGDLTLTSNSILFDSGTSYAVSTSTANAQAIGGALLSYSGNLVLGGECNFSNNRAIAVADGTMSAYASGGAIESENPSTSTTIGSITISGNHTFTENSVSATSGPTGSTYAGAYGGAVSATTAVTITGSGSYIGNSIEAISDSGYSLAGGGAVTSYADSVSMDGSFVFQNNQALASGANGYAEGGAIASLKGSVSLSGTFTFENNRIIDTTPGEAPVIDGNTQTSGFIIVEVENSAAEGGAIYAGAAVVLSGQDSNMKFVGNTANEQPNDIYISDYYASNPAISITNGGTYYFGGGISTPSLTIGETVPTSGNPNVTFGPDSMNVVRSGAMTLTNTNLIFGIGDNFANRDTNNPYITATGASGITVTNTTVAFDDTTLTTTTPQTAEVVLIQGTATNSTQLGNLPQGLIASTLLASYETAYNSANANYVLTLTLRDGNLVADEIGGNAPGLVDALGPGAVLGNKTDMAEVIEELSARSGETIASAASVSMYKMNYFNQTAAGRAVSGMFNTTSCCENTSCCNYSLTDRFVWVSGYGLGNNTEFSGNISGYIFNSGGFLLGCDWTERSLSASSVRRADYGWTFSAWFGYGQTGIQSSRTNLTGKEYTIGALAVRPFDFGYGLLQGGFQFNNFDGTHAGVTETTNADFNAWESTVYGEYGLFACAVPGITPDTIPGITPGVVPGTHCGASPVWFNPYVALQYISYRGGGLEIEDLSVGRTKLDSVQTILGCRIISPSLSGMVKHQPLETGSFWELISTSATFAWHHELSDARGRFSATGANGTGLIYGNSSGRDWAEISWTVSAPLTHQLTASGTYYLFVNGNSTINAGMGTLRFTF